MHGSGGVRLDSRPVRDQDVLVQEAKDVHLLLHPRSGEYFTLDEVGGRIWELCDGRAVSEIVDQICLEYEAARGVIEADVLGLLTELAAERLVSEAS